MSCSGRLDTHFVGVRACQADGSPASIGCNSGGVNEPKVEWMLLSHVHLVEKASELLFASSIIPICSFVYWLSRKEWASDFCKAHELRNEINFDQALDFW